MPAARRLSQPTGRHSRLHIGNLCGTMCLRLDAGLSALWSRPAGSAPTRPAGCPTQSPISASPCPVASSPSGGMASISPSTQRRKSRLIACESVMSSLAAFSTEARSRSLGILNVLVFSIPHPVTHCNAPVIIPQFRRLSIPPAHQFATFGNFPHHSCPSSTGARRSCQRVHATSAMSKTAITTIAAPSRATPAPGHAPAAGCATHGGRRMGGTCR